MSVQTAAPTAAPTARKLEKQTGFASETGRAWLFIAPFGIFFLAFLILPVIYMVIASLFDTSLVRPGLGNFLGFANYREMLGREDFWKSLWHTLQFTIYTVPPLVILSFVLAVLANRVARGQWFFRLAFFVPFILPSAAIALIWNHIYSPTTGLWNSFEALLGVADPKPVLGTPDLAMIGIAVTTIWWTIGFNFILYVAGLQDISRDVYEAASVDGATPWQQIRFITIPLLNRTTSLVIMLQIIASLKVYDQVYLMTNGGPGTSTQVLLLLATNTAFTDNRIGAASAASVLLFLIILLVSAIWRSVQRAQDRKAA